MLQGKTTLVMVITAFGAALGADRVEACGGLFCSQASPTPIDQSAERILFEILDDGSVSATVEIKYQGNPNEFSWIVPVTGTPDFVDVAGKDELQLLDSATAPQFVQPLVECDFSGNGGGGFPSFGCASDADSGLSGAAGGDDGFAGVNVTEYPSVGPFDGIVVVDGGNADALVTWLVDHGYQVTDEMRPFIEQYTVEGYKFLATRLRADAGVQDMVPIRFHCPQPNPEIPLRLTAISAEPEMGFLVFVVGAERYAPLNYADVAIDIDDVRLGNSGSNYFPLVSKRIDEAGGQGFVTEAVRGSADVAAALGNVFLGTETEAASRERLTAVLSAPRIVTRFYARMNGEEMTVDPIFAPSGNTALKPGVLDLSTQRSPEQCTLETPPACGLTYCGDGDACGATDLGVDGCVCRGTHTARLVTAPGGFQVACMPPDIDLHGGGRDPCSGSVCGDGTCLPVNDRATCRCDDDAVAVNDNGVLRCVARVGAVVESDAIVWPLAGTGVDPFPDEVDESSDSGCGAVQGARVGGLASFVLLFGSAALLRLLRRRR